MLDGFLTPLVGGAVWPNPKLQGTGWDAGPNGGIAPESATIAIRMTGRRARPIHKRYQRLGFVSRVPIRSEISFEKWKGKLNTHRHHGRRKGLRENG
jgi:hypothetical protein